MIEEDIKVHLWCPHALHTSEHTHVCSLASSCMATHVNTYVHSLESSCVATHLNTHTCALWRPCTWPHIRTHARVLSYRENYTDSKFSCSFSPSSSQPHAASQLQRGRDGTLEDVEAVHRFIKWPSSLWTSSDKVLISSRTGCYHP